ncbi:MAG: hypothetical protein ACI4EN_09730, partial [Butyrivibrio sp.]
LPEDKEDTMDMSEVDGAVYNDIYEVLSSTSIGKYLTYSETEFEIDTKLYINDYIACNNREGIELSKYEMIQAYGNFEEFWQNHHIVITDDLIYIEDAQNRIVKNCAYIMISENEEIKEALISNGYEAVYELFEYMDKELQNKLEKAGHFAIMYTMEAFGCEIINGYFGLRITEMINYIPKEALYLTKLYQNDCWSIRFGGVNNSLECLNMTCTDCMNLSESVSLNLYGHEGTLKEIKLICYKSSDTIPDYCMPTVTACLKAMGCSDNAVSAFSGKIPKASGSMDNLYFIVDNTDNNTIGIKLFVK